MANLSANADLKTAPRGETAAYKITNALQLYGHSLLGLDDSTGYVVKWADTAGIHWLGVSREKQLGDTSADVNEVSVDTGGKILRRVAVTGASAITDVGNPVYGTSDNHADLTLTPTVNVGAIGTVKRWWTSTTCDVQTYTPTEYLLSGGGGGGGFSFLSFSIPLASLADGDIITTMTPGFAGVIKKMFSTVTTVASTASKASTLNLEIGTTNVTGGALALTTANCDTLGETNDATAITAANYFGPADTISVEASSTTTFIEGVVELVIVIQSVGGAA